MLKTLKNRCLLMSFSTIKNIETGNSNTFLLYSIQILHNYCKFKYLDKAYLKLYSLKTKAFCGFGSKDVNRGLLASTCIDFNGDSLNTCNDEKMLQYFTFQ